MTPATVITTLATLLWCYVAVLGVAWVRAVGALDRREHVPNFVSLIGVFVPCVALTVAVVLLGVLTGLPQIVLAPALLFPGAVAAGIQLEVARLAPSGMVTDATRLGLAVGLSALYLAAA